MEPDEEYIDIQLRSAEEVARRCIILASLLQIAAAEFGQKGLAIDDLETMAFDLREWLRGQDLWRELAPTEANVLERLRGSGATSGFLDPLLVGESLSTLGWALSTGPAILPLQGSSPEEIVSQVPEPWDSSQTWVESRELRPESEIVSQREMAELWHWRLEAELARREAGSQDRLEIDAGISDVRREAIDAGLLSTDATSNDLDTWDTVVGRESDELASLQSLSEQRLKALNWVCGFGEIWDDVPLDV